MATRTPSTSNLVEVLDRVLDKGIVIDIWARVSVIGIELLTVEARVVVASVDTFLHYASEIAKLERITAEDDLEMLEEFDIGRPAQEEAPEVRPQ